MNKIKVFKGILMVLLGFDPFRVVYSIRSNNWLTKDELKYLTICIKHIDLDDVKEHSRKDYVEITSRIDHLQEIINHNEALLRVLTKE